MGLGLNLSGKAVSVGPSWSLLFLAMGMGGLLFHAAFDREIQFRRLYGSFGAAALLLAIGLALYPQPAVGAKFRWAVPCFIVAIAFLLAFLRNETEQRLRNAAQYAIGGGGGLLALVGLFGGALRSDFLLSYGIVLALLGLVYLAGFIGSRGSSDDLSHFASLGIAAAGVVVILVSLLMAFVRKDGFAEFTSSGSILLAIGLLYLLVGAGQASDAPLAVLTRRELGAFFYSPLAYLSLFGFIALAWISYSSFLDDLFLASQPQTPRITEPIIRQFVFSLFPVVSTIIVVPVLTMRSC